MSCRILNIADEQEWIKSAQWLKNRDEPDPEVEKSVQAIISRVREEGDDAC